MKVKRFNNELYARKGTRTNNEKKTKYNVPIEYLFAV